MELNELLEKHREADRALREARYADATLLLLDLNKAAEALGLVSSSLAWMTAVAYDFQKHWAEALTWIALAAERDPFDLSVRNSRGVILGNIRAALLEAAAARDPSTVHLYNLLCGARVVGDIPVLLALGRYHIAVGAHSEAARIADALAVISRSNDAVVLRGELARARGDVAVAEAADVQITDKKAAEEAPAPNQPDPQTLN